MARSTWRTSITVYYIIVCIMILGIFAGYVPFISTILGYNRGKEIPQPLEPACQNACSISVPRSSVDNFDSFSLDSTHVLFVHFSGYNLSLGLSDTTDILDPLNLVYVESTQAPFLSLDLGFNVYSFTTLSRVVHHMKVKVEVEPINCLHNMSYSCVTANLARAFLSNVTNEKGVLCYAVNDSNTVNYRCCKGNVDTQQVECDIPAILSPEMTAMFTTIVIAGAIALLCFPALFNIIPEKEKSETLCSNSQVHNPLNQLVIYAVQMLRQYSTEYHRVNVIRKLLMLLTLPTLYYIDWGLLWHTKTYDIPKMFNDAVENVWVESKLYVTFRMPILNTLSYTPRLWYIFVSYAVAGVILCFLLRTEKPYISLSPPAAPFDKVNWMEPCDWTKNYFCLLIFLFKKATDSESSFWSKFAIFLGGIIVIALSPVVTLLIFIFYTGKVSPLGKKIHCLVYYADLHIKKCCAFPVSCFLFFISTIFLLTSIGPIFNSSLLLSARFIVYLWMGIVASKDYYFPRIVILSVLVYYSWNCLSSVTSRYQMLLKQTFVKCKEHQEKYPDREKALTYDDKGVPRISSELFQEVMDQILPRSETCTTMILKLTIIILFLYLTFSSILVYGKSNLNESTKALALFLTALLPKLFEVFSEGSYYQQLWEMENACRVEKIVKDFLSPSIDDSYINYGPSHDENSPSNPSDDQSPTTSINVRDQSALEECPMPHPPSEGNGSPRGDKHELVVRADVNPRMQSNDNVLFVNADVHQRVQSINSCNGEDPSTEKTPLLLEHRGKRDKNNTV